MIIEKPHQAVPRPGPRLFLDSADPAAWERLLPTGIFHGVTTNPLLLERSGQDCTVANLGRLVRMAAELGVCEIQVQTWGPDAATMVETGEILAGLGRHGTAVVIKIPATTDGFRAARLLRDRHHPVTLTAVYEPGQVLAAAGLGAAYAAPYLGRLDDAGHDGAAVIGAMQNILRGTGADTRLLVASLRTANAVVDLAVMGLDTFTFGPNVADQLLAADLTTAAAADFQRAATAMGDKRT
jgi:transaldolase